MTIRHDLLTRTLVELADSLVDLSVARTLPRRTIVAPSSTAIS